MDDKEKAMGVFVIACYRPKPGKEQELLERTKEHIPILRSQGLVTDRPPCLMRAKDGTVLEVFEWTSHEAIEQAHSNEAVSEMWARYEACCDYVTLADVAESGEMFAHFEPVDA